MGVTITQQSRATAQTASEAKTMPSLDDKTTKNVVLGAQKRLYNDYNRWLILPETSCDAEFAKLADKMNEAAQGKGEMFKGTFKLRNFPAGYRKTMEFQLLDRDTPIGQIKAQVSALTRLPESTLSVSFQGYKPQPDDVILTEDLSCHGRGGENFYLSYTNQAKESSSYRSSHLTPLMPKLTTKRNA